jgi:hypothetical protein
MNSYQIKIIGFLFYLCAFSSAQTEDYRKIESQQLRLWENNLALAKNQPPDERIAFLALGLRNMGYRSKYHKFKSEDVDRVYQELQEFMLSTPGHARWFADEIKQKQTKIAPYPTSTGPRVLYDFQRALYFETLAHLPSPETISVLGEFLSDDVDTPEPLVSEHSDWGENPRANSFFSSKAISEIGLKDPPADSESFDINPEKHLALTRTWWREIQSGRKTFSFKGQKIEFRFKPNGTWETLTLDNMPRNEPGYGTTTETRTERRPSLSPSEKTLPGSRPHRVWIVLLVVGGILSGVWGLRRSKAKI